MKSPNFKLIPGMYYSVEDLISRLGKEAVDTLMDNWELEESPHKLSWGEYRYLPRGCGIPHRW